MSYRQRERGERKINVPLTKKLIDRLISVFAHVFEVGVRVDLLLNFKKI